jgi:kynurenine 3-monooxygenase
MNTIGIIGGGLTGSLLGINLLKFFPKFFSSLHFFEMREDLRLTQKTAGKSINLAISTRGLSALDQVGLKEKVLKWAIPMKGRIVHSQQGSIHNIPYGQNEDECLYSLSRGTLNQILLEELSLQFEKLNIDPKTRMKFHQKALNILPQNKIELENKNTLEKNIFNCDLIFITDGGASVLRDQFFNTKINSEFKVEHEDLGYGYKEFTLPPHPSTGKHQLETEGLHIWPRKSFMLIALPNFDGSFTCTLFYERKNFPETKNIRGFFKEFFPDVVDLFPNLEVESNLNPIGGLHTIKTYPWFLKNQNALLLGDSAHAIVPFYGQGMNCCFEDVEELTKLISQNQNQNPSDLDFEKIFKIFQEERKPNTDAISVMAQKNFIEMRDHSGDIHFQLKKKFEMKFMSLFPDVYISQYKLVTFSQTPYHLAQKIGLIQEEFLDMVGKNFQNEEQLNILISNHDKLVSLKNQYREMIK